MSENTLYYGDNLPVLREHVPDETADLIYLDPPFNSKRDYNVLFEEHDVESEAQIRAFEDYWRWDRKAEETYHTLTDPTAEERGIPGRLVTLTEAMRRFLGQNDMMAYLVMMAIRLVELRRVLKPTGSIYLHCDSTASHYIKLLMDAVFGPTQCQNEIIWQRTGAHSDAQRWGRVSDTILFYTKSEEYTWHTEYVPYEEEYIKERYHYKDEKTGRLFWPNTMTAAGPGPARRFRGVLRKPPAGTHWRFAQKGIDQMEADERIYYSAKGVPYVKSYLDEQKGRPIQNIWTDIRMTKSGAERLGYPTQKPLALLERIIRASSNKGDLVLDPFCGCGTAVHAAQRLERRWIGIDITHLAIGLVRNRLETAFPGIEYEVKGLPADAAGARELAESDPYGFQWWGLYLIGARPAGNGVGREGKKGMDRGVDGVVRFRDDPKATTSQRIIVSVKAGRHLAPTMIRDLRGTIDREGAPIGVFLIVGEPTAEMRAEAVQAGKWRSPTWGREYDRIQIITIDEALNGKRPEYPGQDVTLLPAPTDERGEAIPLPGMAAEMPRDRYGRRPAKGKRRRPRVS